MTRYYHDPQAPVQPDQYADEFEALLALYRRNAPQRVLEIGIRQGGTLYQWLRHAPAGSVVVGMDQPGLRWGEAGSWQPDEWQTWAAAVGRELHLIMGNSHDPAVFAQAEQLGPYEFIYIDADHTYAGVAADFLAYRTLCRPGGVLVLHDIWPNRTDQGIQVPDYWQAITAAGLRCESITSTDHQDGRGLGVVYV